MKFSNLLFVMGVALFASCKDDDNSTPSGATILKYDSDNVTGPLLAAGEHELAVRFPASTLAEHVGKKLTEMQVFVGSVPQAIIIKVYTQGNSSTPGQQIYQGSVAGTSTAGQWNNYKITPAIEITGEDLWLGVYVEHAVQQQSIGCDAGPRKTNGDWLFSGADQAWLTYQERTNEAVNWNIRGKVE